MGKNYTADDYSDQLDNVLNLEKLSANESIGKVRYAEFDFTVPTGGTADTSVVALCEIPAGARIIDGAISQDGLGNALDLGLVAKDNSGYIDADDSVADDTDLFLDGIDTSSAGQDTFASLRAGDGNSGYEVGKECYLVAVAAGAWTADKKLSGNVLFVVN